MIQIQRKQLAILLLAWGYLLAIQLIWAAPSSAVGGQQITDESSSKDEQTDTEEAALDEMAGAKPDSSERMLDEERLLDEEVSNVDSDDKPLRWTDEMVEQGGEPRGLDSNIANAKIQMSPRDMATAAGHHHHHKHYVHGWLEMGAHTGKKGAFGWHDKHPVGGKGRR